MAVIAVLALLAFPSAAQAKPKHSAISPGCYTHACARRVAPKPKLVLFPPGKAKLARIRNCESGSSGLYRANTGNGFYGAYQFTLGTWQSVGGHGLPHLAPPREQDYRAALLYRRAGPSPWPICGFR